MVQGEHRQLKQAVDGKGDMRKVGQHRALALCKTTTISHSVIRC